MTTHRNFTRRCLVAALSLAGVASSTFAADFTMRISHQFPPTHHSAVNM